MADREHTLSSESLAPVAPYGPLRIGVACHPWRQGVFIDDLKNISAGGVPQLGQGVTNTTGATGPKLWDADVQKLQLPQTGAFVTYSNGPLDSGIIYEYLAEPSGFAERDSVNWRGWPR